MGFNCINAPKTISGKDPLLTADGTKRVLGLRQGAPRTLRSAVALLEDLQARGLDTSQPVLLVLDGAKALHAAAERVWGQNGVIQRRQVHKKRNVKAHVPEKHHAELERRLSEAYHLRRATRPPRRRWRRRPVGSADQPGCGFEPPGGIRVPPRFLRKYTLRVSGRFCLH